MSAMPAQRPGRSRQDYATPDDFIAAVKHRLGITDFVVDLAADASNTKAVRFLDEEHDSLQYDWNRYGGNGDWCWLNPPYAKIAPWAKKCAETSANVAFLVPAAVGSNWWADWVNHHALVLFPRPRLSFDNKNPYIKDVALCLYGIAPSYPGWDQCWEWTKELA